MLEADRRDRGAYDTVVASCSGRGVVSISHQDPDTVASSRFIVNTENSRACRAFFYELLEFALSFWAMIDQSLFSEDIQRSFNVFAARRLTCQDLLDRKVAAEISNSLLP